ncbi:MAG: response regulator transcription factor [Gemmatimonadaceae bacterium]|nr:response regulator transcription factor [Gloeobacterales cyanobacterium ES-bin-141]
MNAEPVRVLIVDDQHLVREGLKALLEIEEGLVIVGLASNGQEAIEMAGYLAPEVILMDVRMAEMDGVSATRHICRAFADIRVLILTTFDDDEYIFEALKAGATGYLLKDTPSEELTAAIKAVAKGHGQLGPSIAQRVFTGLARPVIAPAPSRALQTLTPRELDVLRLLTRGASNREIGEALLISEGTVKNHITNILTRLNLRDRTQAALFAREQGLD